MRRCLRVGIDVTRRCNFTCKTCFYRWKSDFNTPYDKPLNEAMNEVLHAKARGCDHAVLVGWGEPGLWPHLFDFIGECSKNEITTSIITNGSLKIEHYAKMREAGLNHLHVSVHGLGVVLDDIVGFEGAGCRQQALMQFLEEEQWPWRMNMTVQQKNIDQLTLIAAACASHYCKHIISLGFLPHYEWNDPAKMREVAVHPAIVGERLKEVYSQIANYPDVMFTIRYQPMCHLSEELWKYVVNARYVLYDPWEWEYGNAGKNDSEYYSAAVAIGNGVAIQGYPCNQCGLQVHCGGWNKTYANGFNGASLQPVSRPVGEKYPGFYHDQNPANLAKGYF